MAPRPDVSEERKDQILAAATTVFSKHGFAGARMDDIVAESGLSKGALYWYFDSKDAIIISILDRIFDWETSHLKENLEGKDSAREKIDSFIDVMINDLEKMKPLMPIFFDFWSLSVRNKNINQAIKRYYKNFLDLIEPIIQLGIDQGEFRSQNPAEVAVALGALYEGTILFYIYFPETIDIKQQFRANFNLIIEGLICNP